MEIWNQEEEARRLSERFSTIANKAEFARTFNVPGGASMLSQHLSGHRPISLEAAAAYAKGFGCSIEEISPRLAAFLKEVQSSSNVDEAPALRQAHGIPVVGEVKGGPDGYLDELQYPVGNGEGTVPYRGADPHAYALRIRGDSMSPRYRSGEFVIVEPSHEALPGDDVVVKLRNDGKMLKQFAWRRGDEVQFLSINENYKPMTFKSDEVEAIQPVAGRVSPSAFQPG